MHLRYLLASAIGVALLLTQGSFMNPVQAFPTLVNDTTVQDGTKVTVRFQIRPVDTPTITYTNTERFIQSEHLIPSGFEQRVAGMHLREVKPFPLSAEEASGPYEATKIQTIPPEDLPLDTREGDTIRGFRGPECKDRKDPAGEGGARSQSSAGGTTIDCPLGDYDD